MANLQAIFVANGSAILLLLILMLSSHKTMRFGLLDEKLFYVMVGSDILQCFTESAAFFIDGKMLDGYHTLGLILNSFTFINNILFAYIWIVYVDYKLFSDMKRIRTLYVYLSAPALVVVLGSIVNLFTPVFFRITQENVYERTSLFFVPYLVTYLYLMFGVFVVYRYRDKVNKYLFLPAILFMIPIFIGSGLQFCFYGVSLTWIGVAIALVSLYVNVQNEQYSTDTLSGLYTRQYMNHYLEAEAKRSNANRRIAGIMLDIDQFKRINDTYGHLVGDDAIRSAGKILLDATTDKELAARFAGDEFVVLRVIKDELDILDTISRIRTHVDAFNTSGEKSYQLEFSIGYSIYEVLDDSVDGFLSRMDHAMYEEKKDKIAHRILPDRREED